MQEAEQKLVPWIAAVNSSIAEITKSIEVIAAGSDPVEYP